MRKWLCLSALLFLTPLFCMGADRNLKGAKRVVESDDANLHASKLLTEIKWHTSLDEAKALAKSEGKLVFWMHMLGDLEGMT